MQEKYNLSHLKELEAESIHIIREVAAEFENPVMLYSIGKDSSVMVRLAEKAFAPGKVPFPLMHIDSKWKFKEMIQFRDEYAKKYGWNLIVESNMEAFKAGVGPFTHGSKVHTDLMKTQALLHALDKYKFDAAFGGARRDEEKSRAKERIFSFRDKFHQWDPKNQRPELWDIYNTRINKGESIRVFPISNWTEKDIWQYIKRENIDIVPLYFAAERNAPNTVSVAEAVAQVNIAYNTKLEELQTGDYDSIDIQGQTPDWPEVLAVFAAKTAGTDDGVDVATLDADRVARLTAVFWDMTKITSWVETINHPGSGDDDGWTEYILHITITPKTADEMRTAYAFTRYQNEALDELLADRATLASLASSLTITNAAAEKVLQNLPADLSPERRAVIQNALMLYGKVSYFWGGKSLVLGWDSRWGQLRQVTAAGSSTTGTYRPYGLDCSGFVDWAFYNATGGSYIIGHGGGATMQHSYCTDISWSDAQPGDLVFYPDNSHVGIICGRDEDGSLLVIHCASGANNVVITGTSGFISVARPDYFSDN